MGDIDNSISGVLDRLYAARSTEYEDKIQDATKEIDGIKRLIKPADLDSNDQLVLLYNLMELVERRRKLIKLQEDYSGVIKPEHDKYKGEKLTKRYRDNPKPIELDVSAQDIIEAIIYDQDVNGINIVDKLLEPTFRFKSNNDSIVSASDLSEALSIVIAKARSKPGKKGSTTTNVIRKQKADEYAKNMYEIITKLKAETGVSTYEATLALLREKEVKTPNGGKWHISSLQDLQKRWVELGLTPPPKPEKERKTRSKSPQ